MLRDFYFQTYVGYKILIFSFVNFLFSLFHINGNNSRSHLSLYHKDKSKII